MIRGEEEGRGGEKRGETRTISDLNKRSRWKMGARVGLS
jgi:hypothetical protein